MTNHLKIIDIYVEPIDQLMYKLCILSCNFLSTPVISWKKSLKHLNYFCGCHQFSFFNYNHTTQRQIKMCIRSNHSKTPSKFSKYLAE